MWKSTGCGNENFAYHPALNQFYTIKFPSREENMPVVKEIKWSFATKNISWDKKYYTPRKLEWNAAPKIEAKEALKFKEPWRPQMHGIAMHLRPKRAICFLCLLRKNKFQDKQSFARSQLGKSRRHLNPLFFNLKMPDSGPACCAPWLAAGRFSFVNWQLVVSCTPMWDFKTDFQCERRQDENMHGKQWGFEVILGI